MSARHPARRARSQRFGRASFQPRGILPPRAGNNVDRMSPRRTGPWLDATVMPSFAGSAEETARRRDRCSILLIEQAHGDEEGFLLRRDELFQLFLSLGEIVLGLIARVAVGL